MLPGSGKPRPSAVTHQSRPPYANHLSYAANGKAEGAGSRQNLPGHVNAAASGPDTWELCRPEVGEGCGQGMAGGTVGIWALRWEMGQKTVWDWVKGRVGVWYWGTGGVGARQ